ncbi:MAG: T9SS type A sorting domain-containing protein [Bacteroidetes bacterium]|nr:T9SS type A sorting domain-containing protein [Bacteroidota bacterium]
MKKTTLYTLCIFFGYFGQAQTFDWFNSAQYSQHTQGTWVGNDNQGNVYVAGVCRNSDHGASNPNGSFLSKYSSIGGLLWTDTLEGVLDIYCDIDKNGNIYAAGRYLVSATFSGQTLVSNSQYGTGYIVKYNSVGYCVFARSLSLVGPKAIKCAPEGGYWLIGSIGWAYPTTLDNIAFDKNGFFLANFDENNICQWRAQTDGLKYSYGTALNLDSLGNCYVSGSFCDSVVISASTGNPFKLKGNSGNDFVCKYGTDKNLLWAKIFNRYGLAGSPAIKSLATNAEGTELYMLVIDTYSLSFDGISLNQYGGATIKLDQNGALQWYKATKNAYYFQEIKCAGQYIYIAGGINDTVDFGGQIFNTTKKMMFVAKYDKNYNLKWIQNSINLTGTSGFTGAGANSIAINGDKIFITGDVAGKVGFGNFIYDENNYGEMFVTMVTQATEVVGLSDLKNLVQLFTLYPNPTGDIITIQSSSRIKKVELRIENILGQLIYTKSIINQGTTFNETLNISQYPKGIYFVQINTGSASEVSKIIIE